MRVICPCCSERIDTEDRCNAVKGILRCQERQGHSGWHWSDPGAGGAVLRWTGVYSVRSCPAHLGDFDGWCVLTPGHDGWHSNGRGVSFGDPEPETTLASFSPHNGSPASSSGVPQEPR